MRWPSGAWSDRKVSLSFCKGQEKRFISLQAECRSKQIDAAPGLAVVPYFCFRSITNVTLSDSLIDYIYQVKGVLKRR